VTAETVLPEFLRVAAHPLRWRLLEELARSDRRGRELTELLGERQSLVAYHLKHLRDGELVRAHRSSADGRDVYYRLDLARCRELIAGTAAALHPGLTQTAPATVRPTRVLFLCTGNSARSQLAEALLRARAAAGGVVEVASAGSHPRPVEPAVAAVLADRGIDAPGLRSKHVDEVASSGHDLVITLCDRVREACPDVDPAAEHIHWSVPPPQHGDPAELAAIADELEVRIGFLLATLAAR
jgi:protein-tyrosine-phosphatase/DNA-binding transcriptional ArsR family regulator